MYSFNLIKFLKEYQIHFNSTPLQENTYTIIMKNVGNKQLLSTNLMQIFFTVAYS